MKSLNEEKRLIQILQGNKVFFEGELVEILFVGKPLYHSGEGKTDFYILLSNGKEIKVSSKSKTADFLENKINAPRAEQIFGKDWSKIISSSAKKLQEKFSKRQLYYPKRQAKIAAGSYTMGWRLDIINKNSGELVCPVILSEEQKAEIFLGTNLPAEKRNAKVNGEIIENSGVANRILIDSENYLTAQEIINGLLKIEDYNPECFLAFRAVNYRSIEDKIDGNRPLAVWVNWKDKNSPEIIFDSPLIVGAKNDALKIFKGDCK